MTQTLTIQGSTGSVGQSTLDVVRENPDRFSILAITAHSNVESLANQAKEFRAKHVVIGDDSKYLALKELLSGTKIEIAAGKKAIIETASLDADITMAAIVGMAGLEPVLASIRQGKKVAIANKEPLVAAGDLILSEARKSGAKLLPVDSEHNAIFQVLEENNRAAISRLILTASGGPFRTWTLEQMAAATKAQALTHPNWSMGAKISVDSASMMNKALEVIEAHYLFTMPAAQIDVLVHPQSIIHSMVEYRDGSILAQMGPSDMRVPIAHALGWPNRIKNASQSLDFTKINSLTFEAVDPLLFPAIRRAYDCLDAGNHACIALNAANEIAVAAFLDERIGFADIGFVIASVLERAQTTKLTDLESILAFDQKMRESAQTCILNKQTSTRKAV